MVARRDRDVVQRIVLPPDPGLVAGLGANHTLPSAIADLIDNAIDAMSARIRVRFSTTDSRVTSISVIDAGSGMDETAINEAMTLGRRREYGSNELGHFGLGLKAAALSIADTLTVWSRSRGGIAVGRRMTRSDLTTDFGCDQLSAAAATRADRDRRAVFDAAHGTMIVVSDLKSVYVGGSATEASAWLSKQIEELRSHLGLTFHRMLSDRRVEIEVERNEMSDAGRSIPIPVLPIDPFGYTASGFPGYPKTLLVRLPRGGSTSVRCHIWPPKTDSTGFRVGKTQGDKLQGLYIYRSDRLLQYGSWANTATSRPDRQLARVEFDVNKKTLPMIRMNPEKSGIRLEPALVAAIQGAESEDKTGTFEGFLNAAESVFARAQRRNMNRKPTVRPAKGFSRSLRSTLNRELDFLDDKDAVSVRWRRLPQGEFFDIDFPTRTVWLNQRYRGHFRIGDRSSLNDAPVLKALVFLLTNDVFKGSYLGARDKDNIVLWKTVLGGALEDQLDHDNDSRKDD